MQSTFRSDDWRHPFRTLVQATPRRSTLVVSCHQFPTGRFWMPALRLVAIGVLLEDDTLRRFPALNLAFLHTLNRARVLSRDLRNRLAINRFRAFGLVADRLHIPKYEGRP